MKAQEEYGIEFLLNGKPFDKLLPGEKELVLTFLTEEAYVQHIVFLKKCGEALASENESLSINDSLPENLKLALKRKHRTGFTFPASLNFISLSTKTYRTGVAILSACCFIFLIANYLNSRSKSETLMTRKTAVIENKIKGQNQTETGVEGEDAEDTMIASSGVDIAAADAISVTKTADQVNESTQVSESLAYGIDLRQTLNEETSNPSYMNPPGMTERPLVPAYN